MHSSLATMTELSRFGEAPSTDKLRTPKRMDQGAEEAKGSIVGFLADLYVQRYRSPSRLSTVTATSSLRQRDGLLPGVGVQTPEKGRAVRLAVIGVAIGKAGKPPRLRRACLLQEC
jgi:hypothetical protein